jgi:hypothetical protein
MIGRMPERIRGMRLCDLSSKPYRVDMTINETVAREELLNESERRHAIRGNNQGPDYSASVISAAGKWEQTGAGRLVK